jgi:hypothetical protein
MFPPAVLIVNASLVLQEFSPTLLSVVPFMKLCVAPESNNTRIGLHRIENVPIITGAPSGISPTEVKLSLPFLAWAIFFLPLLMGLETCLWLGWVSWCCLLVWHGCRHALAKCPGSPYLKQWHPLLPLGLSTKVLGVGCWVLGKWRLSLVRSWDDLATNLPDC